MQNPGAKIDPNHSYPCPCPRRQGKLQPITLTSAFGCDRCGMIFVVDKEGQFLTQVGSIDPHAPKWYWTGKRWRTNYPTVQTIGGGLVLQLGLGLVIVITIAFGIGVEAVVPLGVVMVITVLLLLLWLLILHP